MFIALHQRASDLDRSVATAVVDENGAPRVSRLRFEQSRQPRPEFGQHGLLVEDRCDDKDGGPGHDGRGERRSHGLATPFSCATAGAAERTCRVQCGRFMIWLNSGNSGMAEGTLTDAG